MMQLKVLAVALLAVSVKGQSFPGGMFPGGSQPCYTTEGQGHSGGECVQSDCCSSEVWISNLCPNYANNVKCCYSDNSCTAGCGTCFDPTAKDYACRLLAMHEKGQIQLKSDHYDSRGNNPYDGASSLSNVRDTCYGRAVRRSKYCANAPGGCTCLRGNMLRGLHEYASQYFSQHGSPVLVTSLSGSCHGRNSWHYEGNTFDIACTIPTYHCTALTNWCLAQDIVEACYPGSACGGHETWVHCAFRY